MLNQKRSKRLSRPKLKNTLVLMPIIAATFALTAYASNDSFDVTTWKIPYSDIGNTPLTYSYNQSFYGSQYFPLADSENDELVQQALDDSKKAIEEQSVECSDSSKEGSLGNVQQKGMEDARKQDATTINIDKIFEIGKTGGCFDALSEFPDLSVNIPTFGSIFDSVKQTLINYATRKVCSAVNSTIEETTGPLKETLEDLSDRGQLDLGGRLNKEMSKKLYEIDPELARSSKAATQSKEYEIVLSGE